MNIHGSSKRFFLTVPPFLGAVCAATFIAFGAPAAAKDHSARDNIPVKNLAVLSDGKLVSQFSVLYFNRLSRAQERYQDFETTGLMHSNSWQPAVQSLKDCTTQHATDPRRFEILWASFNKALTEANDAGQGGRPAYEVLDEVLDVLCSSYMASFWINPPSASYVGEAVSSQPTVPSSKGIRVLGEVGRCQIIAAPSLLGARIVSDGKALSLEDIYDSYLAKAKAAIQKYQRDLRCTEMQRLKGQFYPFFKDDYGSTFQVFMYDQQNGIKANQARDGYTIPESNQVYEPQMFVLGVKRL